MRLSITLALSIALLTSRAAAQDAGVAPNDRQVAAEPEAAADATAEVAPEPAAEPAVTEPVAEEPAVVPPPPTPLPEVAVAAGDMEAGFSASEGAYLRTHDRAWSIHIGTLWQFRGSVSSTPDPSRQFEFVPILARVYLQGTIVQPWIRFFFQPEFSGQTSPTPLPLNGLPAPRLLDFWVEAQPHEAIGIRAGIMRPPFTRSWITGLQRQLLYDRTDANLFFRSHGPMGGGSAAGTLPVVPWDRDVGVYVFGTPFDGLFEYYLGVFNGNGFLLGRQESAGAMPMFRLAVNPLGRVAYDETPAVSNPHQPLRFQAAVTGYYNRYRADFNGPDPMMPMNIVTRAGTEEQWTLGADATLQFESVYLSGEFYFRNRQTVDGARHDEIGAMGLAGWMFWAPYLEIAARFSIVDPNLQTAANFRQIYDIGLNVYAAGNNLKLELRYTIFLNDADTPAGVPISGTTAFPAIVPRGTLVHTVGIWAQAYF